MKRLIFTLVLTIILISILAITLFATSNQEGENTSLLSTYDAIVAVADSQDGIYTFENLDQKEIFSDLSEENLIQIFDAFDIILANNEALELYEDDFIRIILNSYKIDYTVENGKIITSTAGDANALKYVMFVTVYLENFEDNLCYVQAPEKRRFMNLKDYDIIISFDYDKYGYDNATEYYDEYFYPNRFEKEMLGSKTYRFAGRDIDLYVIKDNDYEAPSDNLLSMLYPYETHRQNAMLTIGNVSDLTPEQLAQLADLLAK